VSDAPISGSTDIRQPGDTPVATARRVRGKAPCLLRIEPHHAPDRVLLREEETELGPALLHRRRDSGVEIVSIEPVLSSEEKILVNGRPIRKARDLSRGQEVMIAGLKYRFFPDGSVSTLVTEDEAFRVAATDDATNCLTRDVLLDHLEEMYDDALEGGHPVSLVIFGVDDHAGLTESFDPDELTRILGCIVDLMLQRLRAADLLFRNRPSEFTLVLPRTTAESLYGLGERIISQVGETPIETGDVSLLVTLSAAILTGPLPQVVPSHLDFLAGGEALLERGMRRGPNHVIG
jgi:GGDEF domain-containing protein